MVLLRDVGINDETLLIANGNYNDMPRIFPTMSIKKTYKMDLCTHTFSVSILKLMVMERREKDVEQGSISLEIQILSMLS
jgi:hypothetical protein